MREKIHRQIVFSDDTYKSTADLHERMQEFLVVDKVMVRVHCERFPPRSIENLHARCTGPYTVLRKIGLNAYELDIPRDLSISPVFNGKDLTQYSASVDYPATILIRRPLQQ